MAAPQEQEAPSPAPVPARSRCGRKKYGFYPGERQVIGRMLALRAHGLGFDRIAETLSAEMAPTRSGKAWHGRVVNRILTAELYGR